MNNNLKRQKPLPPPPQDEEIESKEGPRGLSECEADLEAWADILLQINYENLDEAEAIFLARCAESAQEALAQDEKRRAALEEVLDFGRGIRPCGLFKNSDGYCGRSLCAYCGVREAIRKLDALTTAPK